MFYNLSVENFKGQSFTVTLHKFNLLTGLNGTGKTTKLEAVRILLGQVSAKSIEILYKKYGRDNTAMILELSNKDFKIRKTFTIDGKGKVNQAIELDDKVVKTNEANVLLSDRFMATEDFSLSTFLDLSESKQKDYLFDLLSTESTIESIRKKVIDKFNNVESDTGLSFTIKLEEVPDEIMAMINDKRRAKPDDYLMGLFTDLSDWKRVLMADKKRYEGTKDTAIEIKTEGDAVQDIETLEAELKAIRDDVGTKQKELAHERGKREAIAQQKEKYNKLEQNIKQLQESIKSINVDQKDYDAEIKGHQAEKDEIKARLLFLNNSLQALQGSDACPFSPETKCPVDLTAKKYDMDEEIKVLQSKLLAITANIKSLENKVSAKTLQANHLESEKKRLAEMEARYLEDGKHIQSIESTSDLAAMGKYLEGRLGNQSDLELKIKLARSCRETHLLAVEAIKRKKEVEKNLEICKHFIKGVKEILSDELNGKIMPLQNQVNEMLSKISKHLKISFFTDDCFRITAANSQDQMVDMICLSEGEQVPYHVCLLLALLTLKKTRFKALAIELAGMDQKAAENFINAVYDFPGHAADLVLIAHHDDKLQVKPIIRHIMHSRDKKEISFEVQGESEAPQEFSKQVTGEVESLPF